MSDTSWRMHRAPARTAAADAAGSQSAIAARRAQRSTRWSARLHSCVPPVRLFDWHQTAPHSPHCQWKCRLRRVRRSAPRNASSASQSPVGSAVIRAQVGHSGERGRAAVRRSGAARWDAPRTGPAPAPGGSGTARRRSRRPRPVPAARCRWAHGRRVPWHRGRAPASGTVFRRLSIEGRGIPRVACDLPKERCGCELLKQGASSPRAQGGQHRGNPMVHQFPVRWAFDHFANISGAIAVHRTAIAVNRGRPTSAPVSAAVSRRTSDARRRGPPVPRIRDRAAAPRSPLRRAAPTRRHASTRHRP